MLPKSLFLRFPFLSICSSAFSTKKCPYKILGISRTASTSQIKKAYYKLAQVHHPDKNNGSGLGSKEMFTQINGAYEILSDQSRRKQYDQGNGNEKEYEGFENQAENQYNVRGQGQTKGKGQGMDGFENIFEEMFGFRTAGKKEKESEKIVLKVDLEFEESVNGVKKDVKYNKKCICSSCKGTKLKPGSQPQQCGACNGKGHIKLKQGAASLRTACGSCKGVGKKITNPCVTCKGTGIQNVQAIQQITFSKGIDNQSVLKFKGKGNLNGDLQIRVHVKKHPKFRRIGIDVHTTQQISIVDAVLGCQFGIQTIYGQQKAIKLEPGCQNNHEIRLPKQGFHRANSSVKGTHIISIRIKVPTKLSEEERSLFEQLKKIKRPVNYK